MKKKIALLMALVMLSGTSMSCGHNDRDRRREEREQEEDEDEEEETSGRTVSTFDPDPVDITEGFDTFYAEPVDTPWVLENNVPFTSGNVTTYFNQFITDYGHNQEIEGTEIYGNTATLYRPVVRHYPAEQPGYTVYDIEYSIDMPMSAFIPDSAGSSYTTMWWYEEVAFLDYYTGMTLPEVVYSLNTDSYCVSGDVVYEGHTYTVYRYEYRETEEIANTCTSADGGTIWNIESVTHVHTYFIVPTGYDGLVMYVYTADNSDVPFDEMDDPYDHYYEEPHIFGEAEDENFDDYAFLSIRELG